MRVGIRSILVFFLFMEVVMSKRVVVSVPKMPAPKPQVVKTQPVKAPAVKVNPPIAKPSQGTVGGKSLIPSNLKQFPLEKLQEHNLRELRKISENRAKPPVNRIIKPPFVMPKEGNT